MHDWEITQAELEELRAAIVSGSIPRSPRYLFPPRWPHLTRPDRVITDKELWAGIERKEASAEERKATVPPLTAKHWAGEPRCNEGIDWAEIKAANQRARRAELG